MTLIFDADDTLWHNETLFVDTHRRFACLLAPYFEDVEALEERLLTTERRNLEHFGYGVKGFALSMIETAIEVTDGAISTDAIAEIITLAKSMLAAPVELLPEVAETLQFLAQTYRLGVITKGDLLNQETKLARAGIGELFDFFEVVSEKNTVTYASVLKRHGLDIDQIVMVGNSPKSDIEPILRLGGRAVHIPYTLTWVLEQVELASDLAQPDRFGKLERIAELPDFLNQWL